MPKKKKNGEEFTCPFSKLCSIFDDIHKENDDIIKHIKNAKKEVLLAIRAGIDKAINNIDKKEKKKPRKVKVE